MPPTDAMFNITGGFRGDAYEPGAEGEGAKEVPFDIDAAARKFEQNARDLRGLSWDERVVYRLPGSFSIELNLRVASDENGDPVVKERHRRVRETQGVTRAADARPPDEEDQRRARLLAALIRAYTSPPPGAMTRVLESGPVSDGSTQEGYGLLWFDATDFLMPGDRISISIAKHTTQPERLEFHGEADGAPVEGVTTYRALPDGTFYPHRTELRQPDTGIQVIAERSNFRTQPGV